MVEQDWLVVAYERLGKKGHPKRKRHRGDPLVALFGPWPHAAAPDRRRAQATEAHPVRNGRVVTAGAERRGARGGMKCGPGDMAERRPLEIYPFDLNLHEAGTRGAAGECSWHGHRPSTGAPCPICKKIAYPSQLVARRRAESSSATSIHAPSRPSSEEVANLRR